MSEQEAVQAVPDAPKKRSAMLIALLLVCGLAGGGVGGFIAAPMLFGATAPEGEAGEEGHAPPPRPRSGGHGRSSGPIIYLVENVVLNPSGTAGTRFLMVTAAFELSSADVSEELRGRDPEIRDMINRNLGSRTVEELTDLVRREEIRDDLRATLNEMLHYGSVEKVYLPQFVIQ